MNTRSSLNFLQGCLAGHVAFIYAYEFALNWLNFYLKSVKFQFLFSYFACKNGIYINSFKINKTIIILVISYWP